MRGYPCRELGLLVKAELRVNSTDVNTYGVEADPEAPGDGFGAVASGNQQRHLEFSRRQELDGISLRLHVLTAEDTVAPSCHRERGYAF
jgi:hypothetical protein